MTLFLITWFGLLHTTPGSCLPKKSPSRDVQHTSASLLPARHRAARDQKQTWNGLGRTSSMNVIQRAPSATVWTAWDMTQRVKAAIHIQVKRLWKECGHLSQGEHVTVPSKSKAGGAEVTNSVRCFEYTPLRTLFQNHFSQMTRQRLTSHLWMTPIAVIIIIIIIIITAIGQELTRLSEQATALQVQTLQQVKSSCQKMQDRGAHIRLPLVAGCSAGIKCSHLFLVEHEAK